VEDFLPADLTCPTCGGTGFERERDILDVWFDSGSSHEAVLPFHPDLRWPAQMYLEGSDQHRGWFQSSLLVGLGTRGRPPFSEVLTHGFLIDVDGRKMSKSVGNVILPQDVIKESGAEILRLWVAMSDFREELRVGKQILARVVEAYRKFRNTLRYLASNLYDFDPAADRVAADALQEVDAYILSRYGATADAVIAAYERYDYPAIFQTLNQFLTVDLSAFYADVSKDRLYTLAAASPERRSAQTAMYVMAEGLARLLAPILPVTSDELWRHLPAGSREASVHLSLFPDDGAALARPEVDARWERLRAIRDDVNRALETARQEKIIGTSLQAHVRLSAGGASGALLQEYSSDLPMLFIASQVTLDPGGPEGVSVSVTRAEGQKCERCWRTVPDVVRDGRLAGLCSRCVEALEPGDGREVA
jgi:isoleucyl-tRNA synthetase